MRVLTTVAAIVAISCIPAPSALAGTGDPLSVPLLGRSADAPRPSLWAVDFEADQPVVLPSPLRLSADVSQTAPPRRPVPVEYSEAYKVRAKIHKISSFFTLPLFITDYALGQQLYNNPGDESKKGVHAGFAAATGVLFGVNTVTGAWNLWEGRKDPNHRTKRMTHGILMMVADAGFLATAMMAPNTEEGYVSVADYENQRSNHRAVALTSMGIATVSYLIMLFGGH